VFTIDRIQRSRSTGTRNYTLVDIKASLCDLVHHRARLARIDEA
jgi:hypothetical protein